MMVVSIVDSVDLFGKERANLQVVRVLRSNGIDVKIAINNIANKSVRDEVSEHKEFEFPRNIEGKFRSLRFVKAFIHTLFSFSSYLRHERPDAILVPTEIALTYLYIPLLLSKAKVVFRCGDSPIVFRKTGIASKVYGWLWKYLILKRVDTLVCNAKFIQDQMVASGRKLKLTDPIIYNFPPTREVVADKAEYLEDDDSLRIGFMGRIVEDKGVYEMCVAAVEATKAGHPVTVYIGGNTNVDIDYYKKVCDYLDANKDYSSRIKFLGNVNDIQKFYSNVDVACIPSIYEEPMANVVTEAKMHHKLSIIFNQGGMPEVIEHMKTGYLCQPVSVEDLKNAFIFYASNRDEVNKQGDAAYQSIEELGLCKEKFEERWMQVFLEEQ